MSNNKLKRERDTELVLMDNLMRAKCNSDRKIIKGLRIGINFALNGVREINYGNKEALALIDHVDYLLNALEHLDDIPEYNEGMRKKRSALMKQENLDKIKEKYRPMMEIFRKKTGNPAG